MTPEIPNVVPITNPAQGFGAAPSLPCPVHGNQWCTCPREKAPTPQEINADVAAFVAWWEGFAGSDHGPEATAKASFLAGWRARQAAGDQDDGGGTPQKRGAV